MASTRQFAFTRAEKNYICLNCQLRALSSSSKSRARKLSSLSYPPSFATSPLLYCQLRRANTWSDRLRKKLWENGEGPDPRSFKVPGETPEEQEERIREEEEEKAARKREEKDFEDLRTAGKNDRLEQLGFSGGSKAVELRKGFTIVSDDEEIIESGDGERNQEQQTRLGEYEPATRWRGLRHIPEWKIAQKAPKPLFTGFLAREKVEDPYLIERAVQRALVEVWVLKQARESLEFPTDVKNPTDDFEDRLATGVVFDKDYTLKFTDVTLREDVERSLGLKPAEESDVEVQDELFDRVDEDMIRGYPEEGKAPPQGVFENKTSEALVDGNWEDDIIASRELQTNSEFPEGKGELHPQLDQSYRRVAFAESQMKFAVLKRVMQLTGTRVADPVIARLNTVGELVRHMIKPPPAKRLIDDLADNKEIGKLPNVEMWEKRYTEKDRETEIGRWKLIEAELQRRGLPLDRLERSDRGSFGKVRLKDLIMQNRDAQAKRLAGDAEKEPQ